MHEFGEFAAQRVRFDGELLHLRFDGSVLLLADGECGDHLRERRAKRANVRGHTSATRCGRCVGDACHEVLDRFTAGNDLAHLRFQQHRFGEPAQLHMTGAGLEQHAFRDEADDFAPGGRHAVCGGLRLHDLENAMQRCLLGVDEIDRHLRLPVDFQAEAFHIAQSAGRPPDGLRDFLGDGEIFRVAEIDVVGHEERTGSDRGGTGGGVECVQPEVGFPGGIGADVVAQSFEFATSHIGEILAGGRRGGAFV